MIVCSLSIDHRVAAKCNLCNYGNEYPIKSRLKLSTLFRVNAKFECCGERFSDIRAKEGVSTSILC